MSIKIEVELSDKDYKEIVIDGILDGALDEILWSLNFDADIPDDLVDNILSELKYDKDSLAKNEELKTTVTKILRERLNDKLTDMVCDFEFPELNKLIKGSEKQIKALIKERMKPVEQEHKQDIKNEITWKTLSICSDTKGYLQATKLLKDNGFRV